MLLFTIQLKVGNAQLTKYTLNGTILLWTVETEFTIFTLLHWNTGTLMIK